MRNAARSQGAYLGVSVVKAPAAMEADFLWAIAGGVDFDNAFFARVEAEGTIRRFFNCESPLLADVVSMVVAGDRSMLEALFTSLDGSEVVDLLPIPLRRALNFRFVAFMAV